MFRNKLMQFLYGRYGNDKLNIFLLILMALFAVLNLLFHSRLVYLLQTACFVLYILRFLSRNHVARRNENDKFLSVYNKVFKGKNQNHNNDFHTNSYTSKDEKIAYKYFKCPGCSAKLRVPKKKGKITITCPKCRTSFKGRS